jgi:microcystin-dependent protein
LSLGIFIGHRPAPFQEALGKAGRTQSRRRGRKSRQNGGSPRFGQAFHKQEKRVGFHRGRFQGVAPMHQGQGPGSSPRVIGEIGGEQTVTVLLNEMPAHTHLAMAASQGGVPTPGGNTWGTALKGGKSLYAPTAGASNVKMSTGAIGNSAGGNLPHNNICPYLTLNFASHCKASTRRDPDAAIAIPALGSSLPEIS